VAPGGSFSQYRRVFLGGEGAEEGGREREKIVSQEKKRREGRGGLATTGQWVRSQTRLLSRIVKTVLYRGLNCGG
jgi:hypothetical protein